MTEEQHSQERRQDEDRWRWAIGLLVGIALAVVGQAITAITWGARMDERVEAARQELIATEEALQQALTRIASLESGRESVSVEIIGLRRDLAELKQDIRALTSAVTTALRNGGGAP